MTEPKPIKMTFKDWLGYLRWISTPGIVILAWFSIIFAGLSLIRYLYQYYLHGSPS